jgi:hypothetical protein
LVLVVFRDLSGLPTVYVRSDGQVCPDHLVVGLRGTQDSVIAIDNQDRVEVGVRGQHGVHIASLMQLDSIMSPAPTVNSRCARFSFLFSPPNPWDLAGLGDDLLFCFVRFFFI